MLTVGSLCAGIGGIEYGLEMTGGFTTRWQAEIDPFARRVLAKHWPDAQRLEDVRHVSRESVPRVDLITAGFPCQPHSRAGSRKSSNDDRDLWAECARVIGDLEPRWVLAENVTGLLSSADPAYGRDYPGAYFGRILADLARLGYVVEWHHIRAADVGAPHRRERLFILARKVWQRVVYAGELPACPCCDEPYCPRCDAHYSDCNCPGPDAHDEWCIHDTPAGLLAHPHGERCEERHAPTLAGGTGFTDWLSAEDGRAWGVESGIRGTAHGVPDRVHRTRTLGNAVVPQVAHWIGERILTAEQTRAGVTY